MGEITQRHESHQSHEALKITSELHNHHFADAARELSKESHNPSEFKHLVDKINHDLKAEHQHPLSVQHDKHGNITHLNFAHHNIYDHHHQNHHGEHHSHHSKHDGHHGEHHSHHAHHSAKHQHHAQHHAPEHHQPKSAGPDKFSGYLDSSNSSRGVEAAPHPAAQPAPDLSPATIAAIRAMNQGSGAPTPRSFYTRPSELR